MPKVSEVKAMDMFLGGCFIFIFIALLQSFFAQSKDDASGKMSEQEALIRLLVEVLDDRKMERNLLKQIPVQIKKPVKPHLSLLEKTRHNFIAYALYPLSFMLFCFIYFFTYMRILNENIEMHDCGKTL